MRGLASLVILAALAGCAATAPAPVTYRTGAEPVARAAPPLSPAREPAREPDWADGPGTPLSAFALRPEEVQPIDLRAIPKAHVVQPGETLYQVATRYQVPMRALIEANSLAAPFALSAGQSLALPPPRLHVVRAGESLLAIADRYAIEPRSLALLNRLPAPYRIRPGDALVVPAGARPSRIAPPTLAPMPAKPPTPAPTPPQPGPKPKFAWPLKGTVLAGFGALPGGRRNDGIDIAAKPGAPVAAAAAGAVVYAGDDLPGYGNLLLIQHPGGYVTAYAHARRLLAREGQAVKAGQVVAEADGARGLHFQVRRNGAPTDPLASLPPT